MCACAGGGIQGLWVESTWGHPLCREQTGSKGKQYMTARPTSFCRPAEQRKHRATLARKTHCPGPQLEPQLHHFTDKTPLDTTENPLEPSRCPGCITSLEWGALGKGAAYGEGGEVRVLFILKPPLPSLPNEENTNKFQCWGVGEDWLPKPWRDAQVHKTRTGLPTQRAVDRVLKGKIQQHQSHSRTQHRGEGWERAEIKKRSQVGSALSSPGSPGVWGWFRAAGQVSVELLGQWAVGVGRGRAGRSQGEVGTDRGSGRWGYTYHSFLEMKDPSF